MTTLTESSTSYVDAVPADADAERLVLGGLFKRPALLAGVTADLFWIRDNRQCWQAMAALWGRNPRPFSFMDLIEEARRLHARRPVDVALCADLDGNADDVPARLAELRELAERRRRIDVAHRIVNEAYAPAPLRPWGQREPTPIRPDLGKDTEKTHDDAVGFDV